MPRKGAGRRYPHATTDARTHQCEKCAVVGVIAGLVRSGAEKWGAEHWLPPLDMPEERAIEIRRQLFNARYCRRLAAEHGALSVSVMWVTPDGTLANGDPVRLGSGYQLVVRIWPRGVSNREIARRVDAGEHLTYNVLRQEG